MVVADHEFSRPDPETTNENGFPLAHIAFPGRADQADAAMKDSGGEAVDVVYQGLPAASPEDEPAPQAGE